jgi:hypothetical protein
METPDATKAAISTGMYIAFPKGPRTIVAQTAAMKNAVENEKLLIEGLILFL